MNESTAQRNLIILGTKRNESVQMPQTRTTTTEDSPHRKPYFSMKAANHQVIRTSKALFELLASKEQRE
jgi:hypothetical protein